ncbi:discoidin domain-containing protein [Kribbella endophytica]
MIQSRSLRRRLPLSLLLGAALTLSTMVVTKSSDGEAAASTDGGCAQANVLQPANARAGSELSGHPAKQAIDGDLDTRWSGMGSGGSLTLDLGSAELVCGTMIAWYLGETQQNAFTVHVSTDDRTYRPVFTGTSTGSRIDTVPFTGSTTARYVRVTVNRVPEMVAHGYGVLEIDLLTPASPASSGT